MKMFQQPQTQPHPFDFAGLKSLMPNNHMRFGANGNEITADDPTGNNAFFAAAHAAAANRSPNEWNYRRPGNNVGQVIGNDQGSQGWQTGQMPVVGSHFNPINPSQPGVNTGMATVNSFTKNAPDPTIVNGYRVKPKVAPGWAY